MTYTSHFKKGLLVIAFVILISDFSKALQNMPVYASEAMNHLLTKAVGETGALNLLNAVSMHYRFLDVLFAMIILFLAAAGVLFMGKKDQDLR